MKNVLKNYLKYTNHFFKKIYRLKKSLSCINNYEFISFHARLIVKKFILSLKQKI